MEKAQYAIMRFAKYKGPEIGNIEAHNERTKEKYASNPDVDASRSKYNFHLVKPPGKYRAESERQIAAAGCRTRKDSIRMIETLFTASPEFFKGKKRAEIRVFFEEALHFLEQHQSKETIISPNLLIGVGEQIVITRPNLFGPLPQDLCDIVYPSLAYRLMAHSAEDLCEYAMTQEQMLACSHGDIRHGFVLEFNEHQPDIDIPTLEARVNELIRQDLPIDYYDESHILLGGAQHYCTGPRTHVRSTGRIIGFRLLDHFIYDHFHKTYMLVGCVGDDSEENIRKLETIHG